MKQKVMKVGNSLCVTVPADFVKAVGVRQGDMVEVKKRVEANEVVYKFSGIQQLLIADSFLKKTKNKALHRKTLK
ncbi:MAG TPA: AbrB/MazE/SpoVT family DNA-binding domain-containing protein [Candidatus Bathyarchaeia archaeon]|nr:AbrB/MazE/SpoVT family DNA-binding domain-containing protein [Candidatus Bathyarchaeia archaeon]